MGLCECDKDIIRIVLDSESNTRSEDADGVFEYDIRLPVKRSNYKKLVLYIDNFSINTKGLTKEVYRLHSNFTEYNSFNSKTGGGNNILCSVVSNAIASGRTTDFALSYEGSTAPIQITNIPDMLKIEIKDIDNVGVDMSNASNVWILNLRIEAFY